MSSSRNDLHLHEQVLLLALKDRKGTLELGAGFHHLALGGAILAELALRGCIRIEEGKKAFVDVVPGAERPRNEELAEALEKVREHKRRRAAAWVQVFSGMKQLHQTGPPGGFAGGAFCARRSHRCWWSSADGPIRRSIPVRSGR